MDRFCVQGELLAQLRHGLELDGQPLRRAEVDLLRPGLLRIVLRQGRKHQVRRMCHLVGLQAVALKRVRVGSLRLAGLRPGYWCQVEPSCLTGAAAAAAADGEPRGDAAEPLGRGRA